jgi:hypothetical protein
MNLTIRGKRWTIKDTPYRAKHMRGVTGLCWFFKHLIEIREGQRPKARLDTLIHELLHASFPKWSEKKVGRLARILMLGIYGDGWRR